MTCGLQSFCAGLQVSCRPWAKEVLKPSGKAWTSPQINWSRWWLATKEIGVRWNWWGVTIICGPGEDGTQGKKTPGWTCSFIKCYKRVNHSSYRLFTVAALYWFYLPDRIKKEFLALAKRMGWPSFWRTKSGWSLDTSILCEPIDQPASSCSVPKCAQLGSKLEFLGITK